MTYNIFNNNNSTDPFDVLSNPIATKQQKMYAYAKIDSANKKSENILKSDVTWINTSKKPMKDPHTGVIVKPRTIYAGKATDRYPSWDIPVANIDLLKKAHEVFSMGESASTTEIDKALHDPYTQEFQEPLKYYNDVVLAEESAAAIHTSQDFPLMANVTIAGQVIIDQHTDFPLLNVVNVENTTELLFRRYRGYGFDIEALVGELATTEPKKMSFAKEEWYTRKSGGEIQWSDEHEMIDYFINPLQLARGQFAIAANKIKNNKVLKALALFSTTAGSDATLIGTYGNSTNNPYPYFATVRKLINYTNFGNVNQGALNSTTLYALQSNTFVKGGVDYTQGLTAEQGARVTLPGIPGISFVIDESLTDGNVYLWDSARAMVRIQGPIRTEQYRLAREGGSGLVYRDWNDVQARDLTKARTITGLA